MMRWMHLSSMPRIQVLLFIPLQVIVLVNHESKISISFFFIERKERDQRTDS